MLRRTVEAAGERLIVMGCGALDASNIAEVAAAPGCTSCISQRPRPSRAP